MLTSALSHRWFEVRDRLLSNDRFQRWASHSWLARPIARRRTAELFDLCAGFVYSQVLAACVELKILQSVRYAPRTASELADSLSVQTEKLDMLLSAAAALRLLRKASTNNGQTAYGLGDLGAALLGNPGVMAMVAHHRHLYADLKNPDTMLNEQSVTSGELAGFWPYAEGDRPNELPVESVASYTELMGASQALVCHQVLDAYPMDSHHRLLDVGGGNGAFIKQVAERKPDLSLGVFDLPPVTTMARTNLAQAGLADQVQLYPGDFFADPLPEGADLISLIRIAHDHDDHKVLMLFRAIYQALPIGGTLLLAEPMAGTQGGQRISDAYFNMYLLAMGSGQPRQFAQLSQMLAKVGFQRIRERRTATPAMVRVLTCQRTT